MRSCRGECRSRRSVLVLWLVLGPRTIIPVQKGHGQTLIQTHTPEGIIFMRSSQITHTHAHTYTHTHQKKSSHANLSNQTHTHTHTRKHKHKHKHKHEHTRRDHFHVILPNGALRLGQRAHHVLDTSVRARTSLPAPIPFT